MFCNGIAYLLWLNCTILTTKRYFYGMKTVVVTGASKGIGAAIAEKIASEGFALALCARNKKDLEKFARYLAQQYGIDVLAMPCDMTKTKDLENFAQAIHNKWQSIDVLVNNAGIFIPGKISEEEEGAFETQLNLNLVAPYHFTRRVLPLVMKKKHSHIFNMCSTASITPYINGGSYCISKYALYGMTKVLREEMKDKHIKVTAVLPGATFTASWEGTDLPNERFIPAKDIADAIWGAYNTSPSTVIEDLLIRPQLGDIV